MTGWRVSWLAVGLCLLAPNAAHAQAADPSQEALRLGYEADQLFLKGRWDDAYASFAKADGLAHSPVFVLYMARCRQNAGKLLEARDHYHRVAGEKLDAQAPEPFLAAVTDARTELGELESRIPSVRLVVSGAARARVTVTIDGKRVPAGSDVVSLDPGVHGIEAASAGRSVHEDVRLAEGERNKRVELDFGGADSVGAEEGSLVPGIVALALGAVGLGVGAVTGAVAAAKASKVKEGCVDDHCLASDADELATTKALATASTVGFVVGGVGVGTGIVLLVVRPGGGSDTAESGAWWGVRGSF